MCFWIPFPTFSKSPSRASPPVVPLSILRHTIWAAGNLSHLIPSHPIPSVVLLLFQFPRIILLFSLLETSDPLAITWRQLLNEVNYKGRRGHCLPRYPLLNDPQKSNFFPNRKAPLFSLYYWLERCLEHWRTSLGRKTAPNSPLRCSLIHHSGA